MGTESDRKHNRFKTLGLMCFVSDGKSSLLGIVEDLSSTGLRLGQIPMDFDETIPQCKAVLHGPTGDFNLTLAPRWSEETNRGMYKDVGFKIVEPPEGWSNFVNELESGSSDIGFMILDNGD